MVRLDDYEKRLLAGKEGRLKQVCLENILRYAEVLGAGQSRSTRTSIGTKIPAGRSKAANSSSRFVVFEQSSRRMW